MKKIVIVNRTVWVGGIFRNVGDVLEVPDGVAAEMCGALKTGRLYDPAKDDPEKEKVPTEKTRKGKE